MLRRGIAAGGEGHPAQPALPGTGAGESGKTMLPRPLQASHVAAIRVGHLGEGEGGDSLIV